MPLHPVAAAHPISEYRIDVRGMSCHHCVASVTEEVSAVAGVESVTVDLRPATSTVTVTASCSVDEAELHGAIREAGYAVVSA